MELAVATRFMERLTEAFHEDDPHSTTRQREAVHVGRLRAQYQAIIAGDYPAVLGFLTEDIELEIVGPPEVPFVGTWRGLTQVSEALGKNFALVADQKPEIESVTAQGNTVVVIARERGRYVPTGKTYETRWVQVYTFRDDRICRVRELFDGAPLLAAIRGE